MIITFFSIIFILLFFYICFTSPKSWNNADISNREWRITTCGNKYRIELKCKRSILQPLYSDWTVEQEYCEFTVSCHECIYDNLNEAKNKLLEMNARKEQLLREKKWIVYEPSPQELSTDKFFKYLGNKIKGE